MEQDRKYPAVCGGDDTGGVWNYKKYIGEIQMNEGKIIEERNVSEKNKNYTMFPVDEYTFLVDERVHEEFQRITAQLNKEFKDIVRKAKHTACEATKNSTAVICSARN